jgi:hypothetical protein
MKALFHPGEPNMQISEFINGREFHDSEVNAIDYSPGTRLLTIGLTFGDLGDGAEGGTGELRFINVDFLRSDPSLEQLEWAENDFGDVIEFRYNLSLGQNTFEGVHILLELRDSLGRSKGLLNIEFSAVCCEWLSVEED